MLGILYDQINGLILRKVTQIMQAALKDTVAIGRVLTPRAMPVLEIPRPPHDVWRRQIFDAGDAFGGVGSVIAGLGHTQSSKGNRLPLGVLSSNPPRRMRLSR